MNTAPARFSGDQQGRHVRLHDHLRNDGPFFKSFDSDRQRIPVVHAERRAVDNEVKTGRVRNASRDLRIRKDARELADKMFGLVMRAVGDRQLRHTRLEKSVRDATRRATCSNEQRAELPRFKSLMPQPRGKTLTIEHTAGQTVVIFPTNNVAGADEIGGTHFPVAKGRDRAFVRNGNNHARDILHRPETDDRLLEHIRPHVERDHDHIQFLADTFGVEQPGCSHMTSGMGEQWNEAGLSGNHAVIPQNGDKALARFKQSYIIYQNFLRAKMPDPLSIFDPHLNVFGAPSRYVQGRAILDRVGGFAAQIGKSAVLVADAHILPLVESSLRQSLEKAQVSLVILPFQGQLGIETGQQLSSALGGSNPDIVIAAGGGRTIDAGKALADLRDLKLITVPTVASNDAPTSKNYVLYNDEDILLEVRHLARNPDFVVVDTNVLAGAPKAMFAAGLGDALSKKAEALACADGRGTNMFRARPSRLAAAIASLCYDTLITHGAAAYDAAGSGEPSEAFDAAVEAMILMAGLGFESGGLSVPHALTRGLPLVPGVAKRPHGFQVAYGLTVHHRLLGESLPPALAALYRHAGLPLNLQALAGCPIDKTHFETVAEASIAVPHMLNFPHPLTTKQLVDAMQAVEAEAS